MYKRPDFKAQMLWVRSFFSFFLKKKFTQLDENYGLLSIRLPEL